jgi:NADP-reducing hydrogenase subunit HndB
LAKANEALNKIRTATGDAKSKRLAKVNTRIIVGTATCGVSAGAREVVEALKAEVSLRQLEGVAVTETGCSGRCDLEPLVQVQVHGEAPVLYHHINPDKARRIVQQHIQMGEVLEDWTVK